MSVGDDLATTLRVVEGAAYFVVTTRDPTCQERIQHMGWQPAGANSYVRRLSASNDVTRIHNNFGRHLKEMVLQSARLTPVPWDIALEEFLARVAGTSLDWWLYGSAALAARGMDIVPGDLDFAVDDAHHAGRIFHDLLVEPVTGPLDWVAAWIGRAFHGAQKARSTARPPTRSLRTYTCRRPARARQPPDVVVRSQRSRPGLIQFGPFRYSVSFNVARTLELAMT